MEGLGALQKTYGLPLQSHLSENLGEIAWVKELCPWSEFYGDAYDHFGVFGGDCPTIMAHCVHSTEKEVERMRERGVFVAHCPQSNMNVSSGIAPIRRYLDQGLKIGLASDVAGGSSLSMFRAITDAVQVSKLYWRLVDDSRPALSAWDAFYMATKGGGEFFCQTEGANVGSFEAGYELDALVIDDSSMRRPYEFTTLERVERMFYLANDDFLIHKYVSGRQIF